MQSKGNVLLKLIYWLDADAEVIFIVFILFLLLLYFNYTQYTNIIKKKIITYYTFAAGQIYSVSKPHTYMTDIPKYWLTNTIDRLY